MTVRGLHQTLKSTSYPPQDVRLIILGAYNARQTDAALPTAEMSSYPPIGSTTTLPAVPIPSLDVAARLVENQPSNSLASVLPLVHRPNDPQQDERNILGAPCTWEKTRATLIAMGVPHNELGRWHTVYLWVDIQQALQNGWDPEEGIEEHLTPFFEYFGDRLYRCIAPVPPGEVCGWTGSKKDRTISHICGHFNYNPYICGGQCHRVGW